MNQPQSYMSSISVSLPEESKWEPVKAREMMHQLMTSFPRLTCQIVAKGKAISWSLEVPTHQAEIITNLIYSLHPRAECELTPKTEINRGYQFPLMAANPFFITFKHISDLKDVDPLVPIVGALTTLGERESLIYELKWSPPSQNYMDAFRGYMEPSAWSKFVKFGLDFYALSRMRSGGYSVHPRFLKQQTPEEKFEEKEEIELRKAAMDKVSGALCDAQIRLIVTAASEARAVQLANLVLNTTSSLDAMNFVVLKGSREQEHPIVLAADEAAVFWHLPHEQMQTPGIVWAYPQHPLRVELYNGIVLGENRYRGETKPVRLDYPDRVTHVNVTGRSGVGKSTLLHTMAHQDIANNKGVSIIDPHGDLVDHILESSIPEERIDEVVVFDVTDTDYPVGLNLLATPPGVEPDTVASQALTVIRKLFAEQWSATQMEDALYASLFALLELPGSTVLDVSRILSNPQYRANILTKVSDPIALEFWYDDFEMRSEREQRRLAQPINNRLRKFSRSTKLRNIVGQPSSLNFRQIMDRGMIFLAKLGGLPRLEAEVMGTLLISKFHMAAMSRSAMPEEQRKPHYLYIDEVQNYTETDLPATFSEARKYGLSLVIANQFLSQLSGDTVKAVLGNVGASIVFRTNPDDTKIIRPSLGSHISVEDLTTMNKYTAIVTMQLAGQTIPAFSIVTQPPPQPTAATEEIKTRIVEQSRSRYAQPKNDVDEHIASRYQHRPDGLTFVVKEDPSPETSQEPSQQHPQQWTAPPRHWIDDDPEEYGEPIPPETD